MADPNHWNYTAAISATEKVYGIKPDLTREGGSIPVTLTFADTLNKNVLLLPMGELQSLSIDLLSFTSSDSLTSTSLLPSSLIGRADDGAHRLVAIE